MRPLHGLQRRPRRDWSALADLRGQPDSLAQHVSPRQRQDLVGDRLVPALELLHVLLALRNDLDQPVRDAQEVGLRGGHPPASEDQVPRAPDSYQRGQAVRAPGAGDNPQPCLGQPDHGVGGQDSEVRGQGELQPAAKSEGADGRYGWDWKGGDVGECRAEEGEEAGCPVELGCLSAKGN